MFSSQETGSSSVSLEMFFTLYNQSYSDSNLIRWVQKKPKNPGIQLKYSP